MPQTPHVAKHFAGNPAIRDIVIGMYEVGREGPPKVIDRIKGLTPMANKMSKTKRKRLSKGQRTHMRRLKQAARKAGTAYSQPTSVSRASRVPKKEDQP